MNEEDKKKIETPQKALRTYESDVADVLAHKNISTATIAMAEQKRNSGQDSIGSVPVVTQNSDDDSSQLTKKLAFGVAGVVLILLGIAVAYYFYNISPLSVKAIPTPQTPAPSSLVPSDSRIGLSVDNMDSAKIINSMKLEVGKNQNSNTIEEIVPTLTKNNQKFSFGFGDMVTLMGLNAPDILIRSLSNNWMLGIHTDAQGSKNLFVVTSVSYFQNAFAGMLQWERTMPDDIKQYLSIDGVVQGGFIDRIIQNRDVREFVTSDGKILFLYSFIDNTKLVIAGQESTLVEIINRLEQKSYLR